jgi:hypothetical protein
VPAERTVKAKKRCCKSAPRCKSCPVVLKRLAAQGLAEHDRGRRWTVIAPKRAVKAARKR